MIEQIANVIEGPHLLFTGANGHKTYGIVVKNIDSESVLRGSSNIWYINDSTILKADKELLKGKLGLTEEEYVKLIEEIQELMKK